MEKESVILKIQKLLALQYGAESIGNEGEAYQAAKMVRKLLMEHNLSMSDIGTEKSEEINITSGEDLTSSDRYSKKWRFLLLGTIAVNNLCSAYRKGSGKMFVVGAPENVAVVTEVYKYLLAVFRRLADKHFEEFKMERVVLQGWGEEFIDTQIRAKWMRSYLMGIPFGLQENYDSLKPTAAETALTVCHREAIDDYVSDNYKWNEQKRHRRTRGYGDVYDMGVHDGRNVSLNRQIKDV